jgi:pyrroloquinoline quinone (PQQ) biosynthesis protein C
MATGYRQEVEFDRVEWNVLEHRFFARWAGGELRFEELALYASEYEHAVTAIAKASARAAALDPRLAGEAAEELRQVSCWRAFSRAVGWGGMAASRYGEEPLPETEQLARDWEGDESRTLAEHLRTLRAIDAVQSAVSEVMLNALLRHHGFEEGQATEYFRLHAELADDWPASRSAEVNRSYWLLLDGVEALGATGA